MRGEARPRRVLFVCSANIDRSPTAERLYAETPGLEVRSAGTSEGARRPIDAGLIAWADLILVMEERHRAIIAERFGPLRAGTSLGVLVVPDDYTCGEPALRAILAERIAPYLGQPRRTPGGGC
ncbi:MAG: phosphotyrosine protein phosphatase [Hyphomicrobiaceae bacterium]